MDIHILIITNVLENGGTETALEPVKTSKIVLLFRAIKKILFGQKENVKD